MSDFYETPDYCLEKLVRHTGFKKYLDTIDVTFEPCCGNGMLYLSIMKNINTACHASDIIHENPNFRRDYFDILKDIREGGYKPWMITNPPWSQKTKFIIETFKKRVPFAFLLPLQILETEARANIFNSMNPKPTFFIFPSRPFFILHGVSKNRPPVTCGWLVWHPEIINEHFEIFYL
jgi:hypothetical protein